MALIHPPFPKVYSQQKGNMLVTQTTSYWKAHKVRKKGLDRDGVEVHGCAAALEVSKAWEAILFQFSPELSEAIACPSPLFKALLVKLSLHWASNKSTECYGNTHGEGERGPHKPCNLNYYRCCSGNLWFSTDPYLFLPVSAHWIIR